MAKKNNNKSKNSENSNENKIYGSKKVDWKKSQDFGDYAWGAFLIFIGSVFLLNTTGVLTWNVWRSIWRFWPMFIILAGIGVLVSGNKIFSLIFGLFTLVLYTILLAVILVVYNKDFVENVVTLPDWLEEGSEKILYGDSGDFIDKTDSIGKDDYSQVDYLVLEIESDFSKVSVQDEELESYLKLDSSYYQNFGQPDIEKSLEDGKLSVEFDQQGSKFVSISDKTPQYKFYINEDVNTSISLDIGAGKSELIFDKGNIDLLQLKVGCGSSDIRIDEFKHMETELVFNVGAGSVNLIVPKEIAYKIDYEVGVGSIEVFGEKKGSVGKEGVLTSKDFDGADNKIIINTKVGVGSFNILSI